MKLSTYSIFLATEISYFLISNCNLTFLIVALSNDLVSFTYLLTFSLPFISVEAQEQPYKIAWGTGRSHP